jgi:acetylornithine/succinyldiaminopimelate/putrescine aminotransferase
MIGLEMADFSSTLPFGIRTLVSALDSRLKGSLCGFIGALLLADHGMLVAFTEYNRNVIRLEPPLIVERVHIDAFIGALDELLSRGIARIVMDYLRLSRRKSDEASHADEDNVDVGA